MIGLATHPIIFTSRVESLTFEIHDDEKLQNKIEKYITPCRLANAINPAKRDAKRVRNERAMLNFRTEYLTLHPIEFPFWEHAASHSRVCPPLRFVVGRHKIDWGLTRVLGSNFATMHKAEGPNSVEFRIPVMIYPLDNYNYKLRIMTISLKLQCQTPTSKLNPNSGTLLQLVAPSCNQTVTLTNKLQPVPTTDQHCNFLGVPVMDSAPY